MEFSRCIHIMRVRENDRGRGGNSKMQSAVGSVENRAPRKKPILSLSDLFLPRPVRPRSRHHELTITRYPIFAPKPRAPSLRSSRADSRKRSFIQSEQPTRACIDVCTFSPPFGVSKILGVHSRPSGVSTGGSRGEQLDESRIAWKSLGILSSFCNWLRGRSRWFEILRNNVWNRARGNRNERLTRGMEG